MNPAAAQLQAQGVRNPLQRILARVVGAAKRQRNIAEQGTVDDDAAAALGAHYRDQPVGQIHRAEHVGLELLAQHLAAQILHRPRLAVAGIVEQRVERAARALQYFIHRTPDRLRIGNIQLQAFQPAGSEHLHVRRLARRRENPIAAFLQAFRHAQADATGATSDQYAFFIHSNFSQKPAF